MLSNKSKIIKSFLFIIILLSTFYLINFTNKLLSYKCLGLVKNKSELFDQYIKNLYFNIDAPRSQLFSGLNEKYFLTADDGTEWIFKIISNQDELNASLFSIRTYEYSGIDVPISGYYFAYINGIKKEGLITKYIHITNKLHDASGYEVLNNNFNLEILSKEQLTSLLKSISLGWILYGEILDTEYLLNDNKLYTIDFDHIGIPTEKLEDIYSWIIRFGEPAIAKYRYEKTPSNELTKKYHQELSVLKEAFKQKHDKTLSFEKTLNYLVNSIEIFHPYPDNMVVEDLDIDPTIKYADIELVVPFIKALNKSYKSTYFPWEIDKKESIEQLLKKNNAKYNKNEIKNMLLHITTADPKIINNLSLLTTNNVQMGNFLASRNSLVIPFWNFLFDDTCILDINRLFSSTIFYRLKLYLNLKGDVRKIQQMLATSSKIHKTDSRVFNIIASGKTWLYLQLFLETHDFNKSKVENLLFKIKKETKNKNEILAIDLYIEQLQSPYFKRFTPVVRTVEDK
ncbi:MAG: hypothetical protein KKF78_00740 [Candidatus Omnitrophica bacterium]|nr:hypothetical protein [Candidatus Omnitrophota bacterium]MBU1995664.1 hypothetical protein [Candidatus Omnitrophota bacterium]